MPAPNRTRSRVGITGALVLALGLVLGLLATACTPPPPPPPPEVAPTTIRVTHPVERLDTTFVDTTRGTPALDDYPGEPQRVIPTTVWYPGDGKDAPYPLVMFVHGFGVNPDLYGELLSRIAAWGYVVVAPTYPILSGQPAGPSDTVGWDDLWSDTWFVTSSVLDLSASGTGPLGHLIDPQRIAVAGHSDGAEVAFGDGYSPWRLDWRVRSVVAFAADLTDAGEYQPNGRPILHVLSDADEFNDLGRALAWDDANLQDPKTVMTLVDASHLAPFVDPGDPHFETVVNVTVDFLDATLKQHPEMLFLAGLGVAAHPEIALMH